MKKINLIERLLSYSHEKQSPQRFARYAAMLIMLLTLGVGQMWAANRTYDVDTYFMWNLNPSSCGWWNNSTPTPKISLKKSDNTEVDFVNATRIGNIGFYLIPAGTYKEFKVQRGDWNTTGWIPFDSDASKNYMSDFGGEGATTGTFEVYPSLLTFSQEAVLYIQLDTWWNNSGCYHYATFTKPDNTTTTLPMYNLDSYTSDNSAALSTASSNASDKKFFVIIPSETSIIDIKLHRKKTNSSSGDDHNTSNTFALSTGNNSAGDVSAGTSIGSWGTYQVTSTASLAATSTSITTEQTSTLTPSLTSNGRCNVIKSTSYAVTTNPGSAGSVTPAGVFSATKAGTYTVTATITYNAKGFTSITNTVILTKDITVTSATSHDISYTTESTGWTYGTTPTVGDKDETVTFVVTPTDGYSVSVTSSDVTLSGPNASYEYTFTMPNKDVSINVSATENTYTVTVENGTPSSVTAGCATRPSITASTAPFGMTFDHWDVSGGADVASTTSSTTTVSATSAGAVTAVYVQNLYAYVEGRFHITNASRNGTWTNTFSSGSWDQGSTAIQFSYDEGSHVFYLNTYAKASELSSTLGTGCDDCKPYFFIKTSSSSSSLSAPITEYKMSSATQITDKGYSNGAEFDSHATGDTDNANLRINSSDDTYFVTLYFDGTKVWYEYMPAVINNVGLSVSRVPPTAPITATPNMYYKGASNKAYCWGVYTDEECTSKVNSVSFTSLGDGKVQFMAPQEQGTYYLKLTVHSSDDCNATIDDEEVVSFTVTTDQMVFFKNVPGWGNVHFYFLGDDYWSETLGSGCAGRDGGAARGMTRIGNSDVYYYDYSGNSVMTTYLSSHSTCYIAFTDNYKPNSNNFSECQAVYRGDFSECAAMFVPENWITHYLNNAAYYNRGYWTNYMSANSGFKLYIWDKTANNAVGEHQILATDVLTSSVIGGNTYTYEYDFGDDPYNSETRPYTYGFKFEGCGGSWYGAEDDMNITKCTDWNLGTDTRKCGISVTVNQKHKFILTLAGDGHVQVSVVYPVSIGDYRLLYDDNTQTPHPSQYIRKRDNGKDTVAMFIRPSAATKTLKVQRCSGVDGETITWVDNNWKNGSPNIDISGISEDGVYVFYLEQDGSGNFNNVSAIKPYSGKYYIRTNCLDGGWNSYKSSDDNLMTYAQYPEDKGYGFNYYKAKWVGSTGTDVTYTIACDYSPSLCDTLTADPGNNPLSASEAASLPHTANIRFGWHSKTNNLKREYINGSSDISDRYLVMIGDTKLMDENGNALAISGLNANEISFTDLNNWIYRCDVTAKEGAAVKLTANYDGHVQYFIGGADKTEEIIGGSGEDSYVMRVTYDFKTNRLMTAWLPNGTAITSDVELNADMMLIREGQNAATQVYFNSSGKSISEIHTIYGVMEFQYDHMVGKFPNWSAEGAYEYLMYYISFPFDVKVSEIFGCGVRGENWIIQKYNGAKRAEIGWFKGDGTTTFWETMDGSETMNAYEGYLLLLDRVTFNDPSSSLWYKQGSDNSIYLYFPSKSVTSGTISERDTTIHVPEHTCTIDRPFTVDGVAGTLNHMNTDSHWNIMGTPLFQNATASEIGTPSADGAGATTLQYYYGWNKENNTLAVRDALSTSTEFKSMHAYMVQYAGDVTFHGAKLTPPSSVAARRVQSDKNYRIELQMVNMNGKSSETFVELRENACDTFALNEDLYMVRSSNMADLYTFAGAYDVAANVLTVNNHIVPVGMDVKQAGTYRFTMPSAFSGTVTLIDTQAGARTNLALGDYEVNLEKGTLNNRFQLEINIQASTTSLEGNDVKDGGAHKFIENGIMYILRDGKVFDACGNRVK